MGLSPVESVFRKEHMMKQKKQTGKMFRWSMLVFAALCGLAIFCGCARDQTQFVQISSSEVLEGTVLSAADEETETEDEEPAKIYIHVCGAVQHAGVYTFTREARVFEAIEAAGGFTEDAAKESINQARVITDGEELYVPTREELLSSSVGPLPMIRADGEEKEQKVNINTADVRELTTLSGIGETRARAIIAWREENGGFSSPEDLKNIDGIADKTYEKIKDRITVN